MKYCWLTIFFFALSTPSQAHHIFADDVNANHLVHFSGTITGLQWDEPHVLVRISSRNVHRLIELGSPEELLSRGLDIGSFEVFKRVSVIAYPAKSRKFEHESYMYGIYLVYPSQKKVLLNGALYDALLSMEGLIAWAEP